MILTDLYLRDKKIGLLIANRLGGRQPQSAWTMLVCTQDHIVSHMILTMPDLGNIGNINMFAAMERETGVRT